MYRCVSSDVFNLSSICSPRSVYKYTTLERFQQFDIDLTSAFKRLWPLPSVVNVCYTAVQTYMCDYFFPPCVNNKPQVICEASCNNYLHNGVCANNFTDLLNSINSTTVDNIKNCSASLHSLYGIDTGNLVCDNLNG